MFNHTNILLPSPKCLYGIFLRYVKTFLVTSHFIRECRVFNRNTNIAVELIFFHIADGSPQVIERGYNGLH